MLNGLAVCMLCVRVCEREREYRESIERVSRESIEREREREYRERERERESGLPSRLALLFLFLLLSSFIFSFFFLPEVMLKNNQINYCRYELLQKCLKVHYFLLFSFFFLAFFVFLCFCVFLCVFVCFLLLAFHEGRHHTRHSKKATGCRPLANPHPKF